MELEELKQNWNIMEEARASGNGGAARQQLNRSQWSAK